MERTITLSERVYRALQEAAARHRRSPDDLADELLTQELLPQHPHIEEIAGRSGRRAVVRGTRVGVDVILGYTRAGYTADAIATEILPHLTAAQVYDALSYAHDHPKTLEGLDSHSVSAWQARLRERLDAADYARLTGDTSGAL